MKILVIRSFSLQDSDYGIDWSGPASTDDDSNTAIVPDLPSNFLTEHQRINVNRRTSTVSRHKIQCRTLHLSKSLHFKLPLFFMNSYINIFLFFEKNDPLTKT